MATPGPTAKERDRIMREVSAAFELPDVLLAPPRPLSTAETIQLLAWLKWKAGRRTALESL